MNENVIAENLEKISNLCETSEFTNSVFLIRDKISQIVFSSDKPESLSELFDFASAAVPSSQVYRFGTQFDFGSKHFAFVVIASFDCLEKIASTFSIKARNVRWHPIPFSHQDFSGPLCVSFLKLQTFSNRLALFKALELLPGMVLPSGILDKIIKSEEEVIPEEANKEEEELKAMLNLSKMSKTKNIATFNTVLNSKLILAAMHGDVPIKQMKDLQYNFDFLYANYKQFFLEKTAFRLKENDLIRNFWSINLVHKPMSLEKKRHYWIHGPANYGKTFFAEFLKSFYAVARISLKTNTQSEMNENVQLILLDEFTVTRNESKVYEKVNVICDGTFNYKVLYKNEQTFNTLATVIILSNFSIDQTFSEHIANSTIRSRFFEIDLLEVEKKLDTSLQNGQNCRVEKNLLLKYVNLTKVEVNNLTIQDYAYFYAKSQKTPELLSKINFVEDLATASMQTPNGGLVLPKSVVEKASCESIISQINEIREEILITTEVDIFTNAKLEPAALDSARFKKNQDSDSQRNNSHVSLSLGNLQKIESRKLVLNDANKKQEKGSSKKKINVSELPKNQISLFHYSENFEKIAELEKERDQRHELFKEMMEMSEARREQEKNEAEILEEEKSEKEVSEEEEEKPKQKKKISSLNLDEVKKPWKPKQKPKQEQFYKREAWKQRTSRDPSKKRENKNKSPDSFLQKKRGLDS